MDRYKASNRGLIHLCRDGDLCLWKDVKQLRAKNKRLKALLQAALPNIECKNNSQSGLITEIGEFLSKP